MGAGGGGARGECLSLGEGSRVGRPRGGDRGGLGLS